MRVRRILFGYMAREIVFYAVLAFFVIAALLISQNLLRRLDDLIAVGLTGPEFLVVLGSVIPTIASYAVPIAFLLGTLLAMRRLAGDGEILAMRACGAGPLTLLLPAIVIATLVAGVSAWLMLDVEHRARRELVQLFRSVAARGGIIEPGVFRQIGKRVIFVEDRDRIGNLRGIMILDRSTPDRPFRIFAKKGRLEFDQEGEKIELKLASGDLHMRPVDPEGDGYQRISFEQFSYSFDVGHILGASYGPVRPKQMSMPELREVLARSARGDGLSELDQRDPIEYALEIHRRLALPFAPILFALVAVPMGLASSRSGRSWGILLCVVVVFVYYSALTFAQFLARADWLSAGVALWTPNLLFGAFALWLFIREQRGIPA